MMTPIRDVKFREVREEVEDIDDQQRAACPTARDCGDGSGPRADMGGSAMTIAADIVPWRYLRRQPEDGGRVSALVGRQAALAGISRTG